ncbi:aldehyde dehydrogenase [Streptomyces muensis]|uniref:Aldehyde dehydrogenase n=1 Tax=Streptomyces muensis TaxID=1077944 RepID=A0A9X1PRS1_STRM4|nr:aldehyde dehydrogenase family protein [Streptomyces muensis]MCF1592320.1 aldehyde dehydrogenase [Streptomyces muensis]
MHESDYKELRYPGLFIDGSWRAASGTVTHPVINPFTEEQWASSANATPAEVDRAVGSAQAALHGDWADFNLEDRIALVRRIQDEIRARREELADLHTRSMGSPYSASLGLSGAVELIDAYVQSVGDVVFDYLRQDSFGSAFISRRPIGVVAGITPWNAALREVKKAIPALLSGCTVVLKPSPETPFGAALFTQICTSAGAPPGVVNMVHGGADTGESMVIHPDVRKVAFTGSSASGARIASVAAPEMKRLQLELGGKSAAIVLDDVDIDELIPLLAFGAWSNAGQVCTSNSRVLVSRARYDDVVEAFIEASKKQVLGDPMDPDTTMGPLASRRHYERVLGYIEQGRASGAKVAVGGGRPQGLTRGYFVEPTVFTEVDNSMAIAREEIFGPVTCFIPYESESQAIEIANDSDFGLHGGVFGRDEQHAMSIAKKLDTGTVGVNRFSATATSPFGGIKKSGIGREHGPEGFESFLEYKSYNIPTNLTADLAEGYPFA